MKRSPSYAVILPILGVIIAAAAGVALWYAMRLCQRAAAPALSAAPEWLALALNAGIEETLRLGLALAAALAIRRRGLEPGAASLAVIASCAMATLENASYLAASEPGGRAALPDDPTAPGATGRVRFEACIECGLCVSSCPVAVPFIGPAALAAVNREREKRPDRAAAMLAIAAAPDGVGPCGRHLACSRVCPQAVYPGKHIQLLRNALTGAAGR